MPEKTIHQQPVTLAHVSQVNYQLYGTTGPVDVNYVYTPVDETGAPVGERRALSESKTGPAAAEIRTWVTNEVLPEINAHEGT